MTQEKVNEEIKSKMMSKFELMSEDFTDTSVTLNNLGLDELDTMELIMELEDMFEIEILDEEITRDSTFKQVCDFVSSKTRL